MARIREKTLKFPGLDNVYTFADEADLFDANVDCAVGEYRIYDGDLYCCTTPHTGAWDASHFKAVKMGKEVSGLKSVITHSLQTEENATFVQDKYITTNGAVGTVVDVEHPTSNNSFSYAVVKCRKGDIFTIKGSGGSGARLWCFTDNEYKILSKSAANVSTSNLKLTADSDGYLIQNSSKNSSPTLTHEFYYEDIPTKVNQLTTDVVRLDSEIDAVSGSLGWSNTIDFSKETEYNYIITISNVWSGTGERWCYILPVLENTVSVDITANSTNSARYALLKTGSPAHSTTPDFCTGYESIYTITANTTEHIVLPDDCNYVYIQKSYEDVINTPSSAIFNGFYNVGEINSQVEKIKSIASAPSQLFNIDLANEEEYSILSNYDTENITADGYVPDTGWSNRLKIGKYISCDDVKYRATISLGTAGTGICIIGTESMAGSGSDHATLVEFDFGNATVSFLTGSDAEGGANIDGKTIPEYVYDDFALSNLSGTEYRIEIGRESRCPYAKVYNLTTGQLCGEKKLTVYETNSGYGGKAGALYDYPNLGVVSGTITFKRISASVPTGKFCVFIGDSNTEGSKLALDDVWTNKCIEYLGSGLNCGRGGGNIEHAIACAADIVPAVSPKYVVVTIGTNGTPTAAQFEKLVSLIKATNAIPIINCIPMNNRGNVETVDALVLALGTDCVRLDLATAINNDVSDGQNTSLFASDNLHLNADGGVAAYNRFIADVGWIKN